MSRKILLGWVVGSLFFAAFETCVFAGTPAGAPQTAKKSKFAWKKKKDRAKGRSAPELGFVQDILDMKDWKSLREEIEHVAPYTSLSGDGQPSQDGS